MSLIQTKDSLPFAPEPPRDAVRALKQIDERLDMRYLPIGEGCWAITEKWGENDGRRERIRKGELAPTSDFDILGFAPQDMPAGDAVGYLQAALRKRVTDRPELQGMIDLCIQQNLTQSLQNVAPMKEFAAEIMDANMENIGGKIISRGAGFDIIDGKVVGTPFKPKRGLNKNEKDAQHEMTDR